MRGTLFDRFESADEPGVDALIDDIADLLGARRPYQRRMPGILNWGLAIPKNLSPQVQDDCEYLARHVEDLVREFEPRLARVRVGVVSANGAFTYKISARVVDATDQFISLRVLTPRRGGGLGADVVVLGTAGGEGA